jgi:hypothetical protein
MYRLNRLVMGTAAACTLLGGCYTTVPVETVPPAGTPVVLTLNDRGRVALGNTVGASATQIEGALDAQTDSGYAVKVSSVVYMNGQNNKWTNERLTIQSDLVRELRVRKFSRSRTALLSGGTVAAAVALIVTRNLLVPGGPETGKNPTEGGPDQ